MSDTGPGIDPAILEALASAGGGGDGPRVLGSEPGYTPQGDNVFYEGDASIQIQNMTPVQLTKMQQVMAEAGLISGAVQWGMADNRTVAAYEQVLTMSNRQGLAPTTILGRIGAANRDFREAEMARAAAEMSGPTRAPFTAQVSDAEELRQYFRSAVVEMTGGGADSGVDVDKMVEAYQAVQSNAQAAAYNAAGVGGTITQAPSAESFAQAQLEEVNPNGVQANSAVERAGDFLGMLGKFGGV